VGPAEGRDVRRPRSPAPSIKDSDEPLLTATDSQIQQLLESSLVHERDHVMMTLLVSIGARQA
jgi:hypothetical protein